jgi:predicted  nucleic acid-binding Zn-ribbon protein
VLNGRRRVSAAITAALLAVAIGSVPSSPAQAEPTIDEVQTRVDRLYHEAEQASERYNAAKVELEELRKDLGSLRADEDRQDDRLTSVREQVQDSIISQYQGSTLSAVGQAVVSDDPGRFLSQLTTIAAYNDIQSQLFADYTTELKALDIRRGATEDRRAQMAALEEQLASSRRRSARSSSPPAAATSDCRPTSRRPVVRPPPCSTPWARSATATSTARPAPARSTVPGSP